MLTYDLYGIRAGDLKDARRLVEALLCVTLAGNDSSYCFNYSCRFSSGERVILRSNWNPLDEDGASEHDPPMYTEPEFKEFAVLIFMEDTTANCADECKTRLLRARQIEFLRREEY